MASAAAAAASSASPRNRNKTVKQSIYDILEAKTLLGRIYEKLTILLILLNVASFIGGSVFLKEYNPNPPFQCDKWCDAIWFGNNRDNALSFLEMGATSVLELLTVFVFTVDYLLRFWTANLEKDKFEGFTGRIRFLFSFDSLVDIASTVPFYVDTFILRESDLTASQFLRMFRLFRMMRVEGRYDLALGMLDDVLSNQRDILGTALFVGATTWMVVSSLYYLAERKNTDMIFCGFAPDYCGEEVDTSLCTIDDWGVVNCTQAGCPPTDDYPEPCYNLFRSIPAASYPSLLNLFGEFPLIDHHNIAGKVIGTLVAVVAVAVFALPAGIIGNGFEDVLSKRREESKEADKSLTTEKQSNEKKGGFIANQSTFRGSAYNFFHAQTSATARLFEALLCVLVVGTTLTFMLDTVTGSSLITSAARTFFDQFEFVSAVVFTMDYIFRVYSAPEDPTYGKHGAVVGRIRYATNFLSVVDLLSFLPFWVEVLRTGRVIAGVGDSSTTLSTAVKCLRLLRLLRFDRYTHAFTTFDDVIRESSDILAVTGFTALIMWVFFGAILYFTERDNPDTEMASYYKTVPNAMWVTLLNLSGESPLSNYSTAGKVVTGVIGLFASGLFGIPIGVLGSGFEETVEEDDGDEGEEAKGSSDKSKKKSVDSSVEPESEKNAGFEADCFRFVNGEGSKLAEVFELSTYGLIVLSVTLGIVQTVSGYEDFLQGTEWFTIYFFTFEYFLRFIGAPADPEFKFPPGFLGIRVRLGFLFSFFSIVDLLAIVPFYYASAMPGSWADENSVYLRMFRLLRLMKLEKYIPSITLIDDVVRLKRKSLVVTGFAAGALWIIFAGLLYLAEHSDTVNAIDPVPLYGCDTYEAAGLSDETGKGLLSRLGRRKIEESGTPVLEYNCFMSNRFQNFFDSMVYTGIHLTGDFPIITYTSIGRVICFFMVIAAVGVVAIPSGIIASGFAEIVQGKTKARTGGTSPRGNAGDDWYEFRLAELKGKDPPPSRFGPLVDRWQTNVHEFLDGKKIKGKEKVMWTRTAYAFHVFFFVVIVLNVGAVVMESIPEVDRFIGDEPGNAFDALEYFSVVIFTAEYLLQLFSAPKNRNALFSTWVYATTFFGIVDFLSIAPWFVQQSIRASGSSVSNDMAKVFRIFRVFRILQLEDFIVAFSKLDNVFRASKDVLKATGLMALIIWVGCGALFFLFEENNPNWRECDPSIPPLGSPSKPGCYDFSSTAACNEFYPGMCTQGVFTNLPSTLFFTAVFLVGEWGVVDFTWPGRIVCLFLCVAGIGLYAIPVGTLFDSFGAVLGMGGDDEEEDEGKKDE